MLNAFIDELQKYNFQDERSKNIDYTDLDLTQTLKTKSDETYLNSATKVWHVVFFCCFCLGIVFLYIAKSYNLQIFKQGTYSYMAEANRTRRSLIQPDRGVITDHTGQVLVRNKPAFDVQVNTAGCRANNNDFDSCTKIISELALTFNVETKNIDLKPNEPLPVITIATGLSKDKIINLEANLYKYPGVTISISPVREYVYPEPFAHVIGYVGLDEKTLYPKYIGKSGVEKTYNETLTGIQGSEIIQIDSLGKDFKLIAKEDSFPGKNVSTYLSKDLQVKAYELLKTKVVDKKATGGVVVAQDPKTGGIRALVSYPSYDPNKLISGLSKADYDALINDPGFPFYNRAISAAYPPGSTFKMIMASAVLQENVATKDTTIFDPGYIQIGSFIFRNWKLSGHGEVNILKALQVSNDTYFYTVGGGYGNIKGLGIEKIYDWSTKFGFGNKTYIDIDGEVKGFMPNGKHREWYLGDNYITTIGQGDVLATPLQVNNAATYFANGGYIFKPLIVKNIDGRGEIETQVIAQNLISRENYEIVRQGLKMAVEPGGTAYPLFDFAQRHNGIELGGKTGTSEYIDAKGEPKTHAWLTVFGPYQDADIVLTVFLEGGGSGSDDAGPIAKELLDVWFGKR